MKEAIIACLGLAGLSGVALFGVVDDWFHVNRTEKYIVEHTINKHTVLEVTRGPLSQGSYSVSAKVTIDATGYLTSFKLYVANDTDSDGVIESFEWSLAATGSISEVGGQTIGTISSTSVSANKAVYRIQMVDNEMGTTWDQWGSAGLSYQNP